MLTEKTIGIIIFKKEGKSIRYLLLHHGGGYWNFPKGRPEKGETELESARRELKEETGLTEVKIAAGFKDEYNYDFSSEIKDGAKEHVYKKAIFFLGEVKNSDIKISDEHLDFGWFDFDTAHKRMFYQNGQNLLKRAHKFLLSKEDFVI